MLKEVKDHERQTYNEVIYNMACILKKLKERNQYDEFLHKIQMPKMKEIWGNKEDDIWDEI